MYEFTCMQLNDALKGLIHRYNNPLKPQLRGFYRAPDGSIVVMSAFFQIHISNINVVDMPPHSWFSSMAVAIQEGDPPYPRFQEDSLSWSQSLNCDKLLYEATFDSKKIFSRLSGASPVQLEKSRIIFAQDTWRSGEAPVIFDDVIDNMPASHLKNGAIFKAINCDPKSIRLHEPYAARVVDVKNHFVEVLRPQGLTRCSILYSELFWHRDVLPQNGNFIMDAPQEIDLNSIYGCDVDPSLSENTVISQKYADYPAYPVHARAPMFFEFLKLFHWFGHRDFKFVLPSPEIWPCTFLRDNIGPETARLAMQVIDGRERVVLEEFRLPDGRPKYPEYVCYLLKSDFKNPDIPQVELFAGGIDYLVSQFQHS